MTVVELKAERRVRPLGVLTQCSGGGGGAKRADLGAISAEDFAAKAAMMLPDQHIELEPARFAGFTGFIINPKGTRL